MKQKRGKGKKMSRQAIGLIEYVLTSEPQTVNEILETMFEKGQEYVKRRTGWYNIPTRKELKHWLDSQPHIESARFDKWTNEVVTNIRRANTQTKYWRP